MGFRRQMHYNIRLMLIKNAPNFNVITDISSFKYVPFITFYRLKRFQIPGVGQLVNIDNPVTSIINDMTN